VDARCERRAWTTGHELWKELRADRARLRGSMPGDYVVKEMGGSGWLLV
jgi:hypothetical protein